MINICVPETHPLTTDTKQAIACVTVVDMNNQECGVYPNIERAMLYVRNWFKGVSNPSELEFVEVNEDYWHVKVDGKINYRIKRTCFRY